MTMERIALVDITTRFALALLKEKQTFLLEFLVLTIEMSLKIADTHFVFLKRLPKWAKNCGPCVSHPRK